MHLWSLCCFRNQLQERHQATSLFFAFQVCKSQHFTRHFPVAVAVQALRYDCTAQVEVSLNGMAPLLVQLLKQPNALTALNLLQIVRCMYEQHPRPKEFIIKFSIAEQLRRLAAASSQAVLVRKQAQNLLDAFQLNVVF